MVFTNFDKLIHSGNVFQFLLQQRLNNSFVVSTVDYCNALFANQPDFVIHHLQSGLNAAARRIYGINRFDHISDIMRDKLHRLKAGERVDIKHRLLVYKTVHWACVGLQHLYADDSQIYVSAGRTIQLSCSAVCRGASVMLHRGCHPTGWIYIPPRHNYSGARQRVLNTRSLTHLLLSPWITLHAPIRSVWIVQFGISAFVSILMYRHGLEM